MELELSFWQFGPQKESSASRDHLTFQALEPKVGITHSKPTEPLKCPLT